MAVKIDKRILKYSVVKDESPSASDNPSPAPEETVVVQMHEKVERPEVLVGATYKIRTPLSEHALYVTISDIILNEGTPYEQRRPFEIFINSKNMDHFQWIVALTRIVSAVFRKGGDLTFLVEELRSVFDPKGGYFKRGGKYMPSLVAEIGDVIDSHLRFIGLIRGDGLEENQREFIASKRAEYETRTGETKSENDNTFPPTAQLCSKCHTKAMVVMDGCLTCLSCGDSKCG